MRFYSPGWSAVVLYHGPLFLIVLEATVTADEFLCRSQFLASPWLPSCCVLIEGREVPLALPLFQTVGIHHTGSAFVA